MQITGGYWNSVDGHAVWQTQNSLMGEIKEAKMDHLKILHTLHPLCMHYQVNYFNYLFSTFISCLPLIRISLGLKRLWIKSCSCDLPWVDEALPLKRCMEDHRKSIVQPGGLAVRTQSAKGHRSTELQLHNQWLWGLRMRFIAPVSTAGFQVKNKCGCRTS